MLRVREGDDTSFALLLERHRGPVVHFIIPDDFKNQAVCRRSWLRKFSCGFSGAGRAYEPTAKFTTWLFRIATHVALNSIRDRKKEKGHESLNDGNDEMLGGLERQVADRQPTIEQEIVH